MAGEITQPAKLLTCKPEALRIHMKILGWVNVHS